MYMQTLTPQERASLAAKQALLDATVAATAEDGSGGFLVTRRMLEMFKKKDKKAGAK